MSLLDALGGGAGWTGVAGHIFGHRTPVYITATEVRRVFKLDRDVDGGRVDR